MRVVAEHIAAVGRLPLVDALELSDGPPPPTDAASRRTGARAARLASRFAAPSTLPDRRRCCWSTTPTAPAGPMTVAGTLLAEAGATAVLPLALHQLP